MPLSLVSRKNPRFPNGDTNLRNSTGRFSFRALLLLPASHLLSDRPHLSPPSPSPLKHPQAHMSLITWSMSPIPPILPTTLIPLNRPRSSRRLRYVLSGSPKRRHNTFRHRLPNTNPHLLSNTTLQRPPRCFLSLLSSTRALPSRPYIGRSSTCLRKARCFEELPSPRRARSCRGSLTLGSSSQSQWSEACKLSRRRSSPSRTPRFAAPRPPRASELESDLSLLDVLTNHF